MVMAFMMSAGVKEVWQSTKKHIRQDLEVEFGVSLSLCGEQNGKLLVVPYSLTTV